ncbi:unnamed protein product [Auanema sp. JU1783]|nr:unnamed protein product [Auanema sp. JU1783]
MGHFTQDELNNFDLKSFIKKHLLSGPKQMDYQAKDLFIILDKAKSVFQSSETLIELDGPVNVCGDIHGQYGDLMRIFKACGLPFQSKFLFLGDYVDRGRHSLEVITLLLCCRIQFPNKVHLLRGNHELQHINKIYGFWEECEDRFRETGDAKALYDEFNEVFALMPLAALISTKILCMHGGLSPELKSLDDIRRINRPLHTVQGLAQDLLWSDPDPTISGFQTNLCRSVSYTFGEDVVTEKCKELDLNLMIRAHQVVEFGYSLFANKLLITVFSAARYHDGLRNYAAIVQINENLEVSFIQLKPEEYDAERLGAVGGIETADAAP